jgi:thioredoxin 1
MSEFKQIINGDQPVLIDFYADWCGPCKAMSPVLKELAAKIKGKARILKVNIDTNPQAAAAFNIRGVPTFIVYKKGVEKWRHSGTIGGAELERIISGEA